MTLKDNNSHIDAISQDLDIASDGNEALDYSAKSIKSNAVSRYMKFIRMIGLIHIFFGLYIWLYLIGGIYKDVPINTLGFSTQIEIIFIAIISCVAGLGLWLLTPWGVTLWILQAIVMLIANIFNENPLISFPIFIGIQAILLINYILLRRKYELFVEDFGHVYGQ